MIGCIWGSFVCSWTTSNQGGLGQFVIIAAGLPAGRLAYVEAKRIASIIRLSGRLDRGVEIRPELILAPGDKFKNAVSWIGLVNDHEQANSTFSRDHAIIFSFDLRGYPV